MASTGRARAIHLDYAAGEHHRLWAVGCHAPHGGHSYDEAMAGHAALCRRQHRCVASRYVAHRRCRRLAHARHRARRHRIASLRIAMRMRVVLPAGVAGEPATRACDPHTRGRFVGCALAVVIGGRSRCPGHTALRHGHVGMAPRPPRVLARRRAGPLVRPQHSRGQLARRAGGGRRGFGDRRKVELAVMDRRTVVGVFDPSTCAGSSGAKPLRIWDRSAMARVPVRPARSYTA